MQNNKIYNFHFTSFIHILWKGGIYEKSFLFWYFNYNDIISTSVLHMQQSIRGIDVSNWQGYIDYSEVKNSGVEIVYIKASQGDSIVDPYFQTNYNNAKANGLKIGLYHFLTATNVEEARRTS